MLNAHESITKYIEAKGYGPNEAAKAANKACRELPARAIIEHNLSSLPRHGVHVLRDAVKTTLTQTERE